MAMFIASVMLGWRMLNTDSDLGRDITLGNIILASRAVPTTDALSWTKAGEPRPPYEWLAQVLLAASYRVLDLDGIVLLTALLIGAAFAVVCVDALERSGTPVIALVVSAGAAVASSLHWLARPHVFTFVFFALWLRTLEQVRTAATRAWWPLPLMMLVWVNMHGGFVFGFAALVAYIVGWVWDFQRGSAERAVGGRLVLTAAGSLVASALTPGLWHSWTAVLANRSPYILGQTAETMPPRLSMPGVWPFLLLLVLSLILLVLNGRQVRPAHALLLGGFAVGSLLMARNIPLFAIAAGPILASWFGQALRGGSRWAQLERRMAQVESSLRAGLWPTLAVAAVAGTMAVHMGKMGSPFFRFDPAIFPVRAADWIAANRPAGLMFNDLNWGGYLLYRLWPGERVYIDSQTDFYGEPFVRDYAGIMAAAPDWEGVLDSAKLGLAVISPKAPLSYTLGQSANWRIAYADATAVVFVRTAP